METELLAEHNHPLTGYSQPIAEENAEAIKAFAERYRVRIRRDGCGNLIIPGKQFCYDMPKRVEYRSHVYDHEDGAHFGVCLMFTPSGDTKSQSGKSTKWTFARQKMLAAGLEIHQNGDAQGIGLFDPSNKQQAMLALKLAKVKTRRVMSERQKEVLDRARERSRFAYPRAPEGVVVVETLDRW